MNTKISLVMYRNQIRTIHTIYNKMITIGKMRGRIIGNLVKFDCFVKYKRAEVISCGNLKLLAENYSFSAIKLNY